MLALLFSTLSLAATVDVTVQVPDAEPISVILPSLSDADARSFLIEGHEQLWSFSVTLHATGAGLYQLDCTLDTLEETRRGHLKRARVLAPRLTTRADQQATVSVGEGAERFAVELVVTE